MVDWKAMLDEILEVDEGLTDWELKFVDDMDKKRLDDEWSPSPGQLGKLEQIHRERIQDA